jgi:hypothetical protein
MKTEKEVLLEKVLDGMQKAESDLTILQIYYDVRKMHEKLPQSIGLKMVLRLLDRKYKCSRIRKECEEGR